MAVVRERLERRRTEIEAFRKRHRLEREARYPLSRKWHYALLALMALVEIGLNNVFFAVGNELGILGAVLEAFVVTILNLGVAFVLGRTALPELVHRNYARKTVGLALVLVGIVFLAAFNLFVAHYRELLGGTRPDDAVLRAWPEFLADPLGLTVFSSWILFGLGLFMAFLALVDGFKADDPYPGYGEVDRRYNEALHEFAATRDELMADLEERKDEVVNALLAANDDIGKRRSEFHDIRAARHRLVTQFVAHIDYLEES